MNDVSAPLNADVFTHIRVVVGIVMGLSLTRLLTGLSRLIQTPRKDQVFLVHIGWTIYLLLSLISFWWFQVLLFNVVSWSFEHYTFILFYISLYFFTCALLYPDNSDHIGRMDEYFLSKRGWFYGLMIALNVVDLVDSALKGREHVAHLGWPYVLHVVLFVVVSLYAIRSHNRQFHKWFVFCAIVAELMWVVSTYRLFGA